MGFVGLATAVSGLRAAQRGLAVTGHNMSNAEIKGYTRQRIVQKDYYYTEVGSNAYGPMKRGLGADWNAVQQIRNEFLDLTYRTQNGKLNFYATKVTVGAEIEALLGELQGAYNFQSVINDMWYAIEELTTNPSGIAERDFFLATCSSFVNKSNEIFNSLFEYQHNLDEQIRNAAADINRMVSRINELNGMIRAEEASGDNANDYRDERNVCLDQLSALIPLDYSTAPNGDIMIYSMGHEILSQGTQTYFSLRYCSDSYSFVEPVLTSALEKEIISADIPPGDFIQYINYKRSINAEMGNDYGALHGLIVARGFVPIFHMGKDGLKQPVDPASLTPPDTSLESAREYQAGLYNLKLQEWSVDNCMIPKVQMKLDQIVNSIVHMINDTMSPVNADGTPLTTGNVPKDMYGNSHATEVFVRVAPNYNNTAGNYANDRWIGGFLSGEEKGNYHSQYSIGNIMLNPAFLNTEGGYNLLALSYSGAPNDTDLLVYLQKLWTSNKPPADPSDPLADLRLPPDVDRYGYAINVAGLNFGIQDAYTKFVSVISIEIHEAKKYVEGQTVQVTQADNKRNTISGVSMDEELNNMMKYQYAYQSAARILNVIDSMIDRLINYTGRAGL